MYKILHTEWSKGWGGQEIRIIQESLEFMKRGYRMMIACQPGSEIHKAARDRGIRVITFRMRTALDPLAIGKCVQAIRENSIDLVHTHSSVDSWCCSMSAKLLGIPVIRSRHVSTPINTNSFSFFLYMKLADRVITSGEAIRKRMIEVNGYDPQKIVSIPAGIDETRFSPEINDGYVRKDLDIRKDDFLLGIVAILRSWKGHFYLLEAVKALKERIPNIKLLIIGKGPQEGNIRDYIKNSGLAEKIIMTGYREDVPQILKSLDLFVLPSYSNEGVPQVIPQAMAVGIPVISTFAGGIEQVVANGQTGILVPPRDARALSEAIYWAYENRKETMKMAHRAREFILEDFTLTGMIERTERVYRELLGRGYRDKISSPKRMFSPS
jgi:glycosyltransferase involved in cell wall biosynthesis